MAIRSLTALAASVLLLAAIPVAAKAGCSGGGETVTRNYRGPEGRRRDTSAGARHRCFGLSIE